jgi:hypothetical protein
MPVTTIATRGATMKPLVRDALLSFMTARKIGSQSEFAKAVKLSTGYVCDVLALRRNLSPEMIERMAKAYGMTRKQVADLHHRAAQVAGWKLPPLPADQQVPLVTPADTLMRPRRAYAVAAKAAGRPTRVARKIKAKPTVVAKAASPKAAKTKTAKPKGKKPAKEKHAAVVVQDETISVHASKAGHTTPAAGFVPPTPEELARDAERDLL